MKDYLLAWLIIIAWIGICVAISKLPHFWPFVVFILIGILAACHILAKELGTFICELRKEKRRED